MNLHLSRHHFKTSGLMVAALFFLIGGSLNAQSVSTSDQDQDAHQEVISAKALVGLPGVAPNTEGMLSFHSGGLRFTSKQGFAEIAGRRILGVSSGDERVETGGTAARVGRALIPYGGGLAVATLTHKKIGLLTVEYTDAAGEYHGAVFVLSTEDIASSVRRLNVPERALEATAAPAAGACPAWKLQSNSVQVKVIGADAESQFPAEDRVLLYERLVQQLKSEKTILNVYRAGDRSEAAGCAEFTVTVEAEGFDKGDQALRASVGPLGHFVGTTKVRYHLTISTQDGTPIVDDEMKKSEGSDSDSLNVTRGISKAVVKALKRSRTELRKTDGV